jgi:broad specificity phosphatase PhoE
MMAPAPVGTLFLVRHGRTALNHNTYVGWGDPPLDAVGLEQAARLVDILGDERIDAIYASPLQRALATAGPVARAHRLEIRVRAQLAEIHYGDYQGLSKEARPLKLRKAHRYEPMPRGESLFDLYRRVQEFAAELSTTLREGRRSLVVAHFWSNRMLVGCLQGMPFDAIVDAPAYKPANGSVLEVLCQATADGVSVRGAELRGGQGALSR